MQDVSTITCKSKTDRKVVHMKLDKELIIQCQQGNKNSFGQLVTPYLNEAYAISFTILHSKEQAEDAVQNAMIEAYKTLWHIRKFVIFGVGF